MKVINDDKQCDNNMVVQGCLSIIIVTTFGDSCWRDMMNA